VWPITAANAALGVSGFINAALGVRFLAGAFLAATFLAAGFLAAGFLAGAAFLAGAFLAVDTGEAFLGTGFAEDADGLAAVLALAGWVDFLAGMSILEQQKGVLASFENLLTGQWQGFQAS
jgi:hypothetical protein